MAATKPSLITKQPESEAREKLKRHFASHQGQQYVEEVDLRLLEDTLINHRDVIGTALVDGRRKRALVPGCGRGVDVLLLESYGYDVVGLEISEGAIEACLNYANEHGSEYSTKDERVGKGSRQYVHGDFYRDSFLKDAGFGADERSDLIYDYTFFCAMQPLMRPAWAQRMSDLLADAAGANLICLEFPTEKSPSTGGPRFGSPSKAYIEHLPNPGQDVPYDNEGNVKYQPMAEPGPEALARVGHWHPDDTHAVGKDDARNVKDYISIWRRI